MSLDEVTDDQSPVEIEHPLKRATDPAQSIVGLKGSGELLQAVLEALEGAIFAKDLKGRYVLANPAFSRLFNRPLEEILGKKDEDLFPKEEAELLRAVDSTVFETGRPLSRADRLTIGGKERVFVSTKVPLRDKTGKIIGLSGFATEITGEIQVRDQIAHLNQTLRAIRAVNQLITKEKDRDRLLQGTCELLIKTRGYRSAWITLFDENGALTAFFHAGLGDEVRSLEKMLKSGELPECVRRALERPGVVMIREPATDCNNCPLLGKTPEHRELTVRLEYGGRVYGLVSVGVPREYTSIEEEQEVLYELAGDLSFALHDLEVEEERRRAQEALHESEAHYRSIVENSHAGVLIVDEAYRFVYVNDQLCRILARDRAEIIGHDFREFLDEESCDLVAERYRRRQRGEDLPTRYEFNVVRKDGEKRRVEISSTVIRTADGNVRTIAQILDITERTHLQQRLDAIDELTRTLILLRDKNAIIRHAIDAAKSLLGMADCSAYLIDEKTEKLLIAGYTKEVPVRFHEMDLFSKEGIIPAVARSGETVYLPDVSKDKRFLRGRSETHSELCVPIKVGDKVFGVLNAESPDINGFSPGDRQLLTTLADSTAVALENLRLNAETVALKEFNERIVTTLNEGILLEDASGTITYVNPAGAKMLEYSSEELVGKKWTFLVPEEERDPIKAKMEERRAGASKRYETLLLTKSGKRLPVIVSARPLFDDGRFAGSLSVFTDITERVQAERALRERFIDLAEMVSRVFGLRDPYVAAHQDGTAQLTRAVGAKMGLDEEKLQALYIGSLLHDIGKAAIPEGILRKPGKLAEEEWGLVRTHPQRGYEVLKNTDLPWPVAELALHHHERLDGSGYPDGLKGDELCLEVRILAVCNVVDAMSARRPWRPARTKQEIIEELKKGKAIKYDSTVVEVILEMIESGELELAT